MDRETRQTRSMPAQLETRAAEGEDLVIEGYFAVFNRQTELWPGAFEEIATGAFDETLGNDIRALGNHDSGFVLGRNISGTLELRVDSHGLWGSIKINRDDSDAMNLYARVKRGDVNQCSFGFNIPPGGEDADWREDGTVKWTVRKIDLHEVSVVTFPAYADTGVQARQAEVAQYRDRTLQVRRQKIIERVKKIGN